MHRPAIDADRASVASVAEARERECLQALARGAVVRLVSRLAEALAWPAEELLDVLASLEDLGWVEAWPENPAGPSVTFSPLALGWLSLEIVEIDGQLYWRPAGTDARLGARQRRCLRSPRLRALADDHAQAIESGAVVVAGQGANGAAVRGVRGEMGPDEEAAAREAFERQVVALSPSHPCAGLAWPMVHTGCRSWRFRERGLWWPALDGEAVPEGRCPSCGAEIGQAGPKRRRRGIQCLVCVPSRDPGVRTAYRPTKQRGGKR